MDRTEWIKDVLVKNIVETYKPWKDSELVECEVEHIEGNKDNFASITYSITVHLKKRKDGIKAVESYPIFAKFMIEIPAIRESLQTEKQFFNEIVWYSKVVPKFQSFIDESQNSARPLNIFPECYYAHYDIEDAVVALEDLRPRSFGLGDRNALDVRHVEKAIEAIARSHALAYKWRETDEESFMEVATSFKESTITDAMDSMLKLSNERVMKALETDSEYADKVKRFREVTAAPVSLMKRLVCPVGPLATICHGDFCRNNILFSESSMNGNADLESILIDFQTVRYASPAIDLSFFFFLSTTPQLRADEFDRIFKLYYDTIMNELKALSKQDSTECSEERNNIFSFEAFKADFSAHAVWGYLITSFFLPIMMVDDETRAEFIKLWEKNDPLHLEMYATVGGEPVTMRLVETLKEILDRGYWPLKEK